MADAITFEQRVLSSLDDVEQQATGSMYITSSDLELVDDVQRAGGVGQTVGIASPVSKSRKASPSRTPIFSFKPKRCGPAPRRF